MSLTDDDLRCVASHRAWKPFNFWLRNGTLLVILLAIFLAAIDFLKVLWVLAVLWTILCSYAWYRITKRKEQIYEELKEER